MNHDNYIREHVQELLDVIDPAACTYDEWCKVGMALKYEDFDCSIWDSWSRHDPARYHDGECLKKWKSFQNSRSPAITGASLVKLARDHGWQGGENVALDPNEPFTVVEARENLPQSISRTPACPEALHEPEEPWYGLSETETFLKALFQPNEYVGYNMQSRLNGDRYVPVNQGVYHRRRDEIISAIHQYGDVPKSLGTYDKKAGAWIRINPLDGQGVRNNNVTDYRYVLVESDEQPVKEQLRLYKRLRLPIAALVYSGKKSLHAVVRIDAGKDIVLYKQRVEFVYDYCRSKGLAVDRQNCNPARLMRLPGVYRNGRKQFLLPYTPAFYSFAAFQAAIEDEKSDAPEPMRVGDSIDMHIPLKPILIDGILRQGHKMMLVGPSKAGKSFALMELCVAIAEGTKWFGHYQCKKGSVLYINFEVDGASCIDRFRRIYDALGLPRTHANDILAWNLRGYAMPMETLVPRIVRRMQEEHLVAIVLDPIYKITNGDENSAQDMGKFCNELDHLARDLGCAVIYCHHYSKGSQSNKKTQDRASGSGVFARDADAILDMLDVASPIGAPPAFKVEMVLREFKSPDPLYITFDYPIHEIDETGEIASWNEDMTGFERGREEYNTERRKRSEEIRLKIHDLICKKLLTDTLVPMPVLEKETKRTSRSLKYYIDQCDDLEIFHNCISLKKKYE